MDRGGGGGGVGVGEGGSQGGREGGGRGAGAKGGLTELKSKALHSGVVYMFVVQPPPQPPCVKRRAFPFLSFSFPPPFYPHPESHI